MFSEKGESPLKRKPLEQRVFRDSIRKESETNGAKKARGNLTTKEAFGGKDGWKRRKKTQIKRARSATLG